MINLSKDKFLESTFDVNKPLNVYGSYSLDGNNENNFSIVVQDHGEKMSNHEITLKAISNLIDSIDFKLLENIPNIDEQIYLQLLEMIGRLMRSNSGISYNQISNLDMVKGYINDIMINK
jgi:hypothetical protein